MKKYFAIVVAIIILISVLCSCDKNQMDNPGAGTQDVNIIKQLESMNKPNCIQLTVGEQVTSLNMDGSTYIELETLNCENNLTVSYIGHADYSVTFADVPLTAGEVISYQPAQTG